jgi:hypothetical protein
METPTPNELAQLFAEVRRLQDIEQIRTLHAQFWDACDGDLASGPTHLYAKIADFFTEDGIWSIAPFGSDEMRYSGVTAEGRSAILESFKTPHKNIPFAMHLGVLPIVEVDGNVAKGRWKLLALITRSNDQAIWGAAVHDADYRRTSDGWRISKVVVTVAFNSPFETGWAKARYAPLARHEVQPPTDP